MTLGPAGTLDKKVTQEMHLREHEIDRYLARELDERTLTGMDAQASVSEMRTSGTQCGVLLKARYGANEGPKERDNPHAGCQDSKSRYPASVGSWPMK